MSTTTTQRSDHPSAQPSSDPAALLNLRRILVPTDFSEGARHALEYATALARREGAAVQVLHVQAMFDADVLVEAGDRAYTERLREQLAARSERRLDDILARYESDDLVLEATSRRGVSISDLILEVAETEAADLIIMGTHGRRGFKHAFLGSVTEEVIRRATVPVIAIKRTDAHPFPPHRILAPIDFSDASAEALRIAAGLAQRYEAELEVVHVVEPIPFPASITTGMRSFYDYLPDLKAAIEAEVNRMVEYVQAVPGFTIRVEEGQPSVLIAQRGEQGVADLIVMATHGRTGFEHVLLGSVAERVIRTAPCPVLVVRPEPEERAE